MGGAIAGTVLVTVAVILLVVFLAHKIRDKFSLKREENDLVLSNALYGGKNVGD